MLIVVDTLRADHLGVYGYARPTSPHIDAFAARSVVFERAFAPSSWTAPSMGSMFTGEWPSRHRAGELKRSDEGRIVLENGRKVFAKPSRAHAMLAETLASAGFATGAVVTNEVLVGGSGFERGFADFGELGHAARGPEVTRAALAWLDARGDRPFFLWVHYFDPHLPYDATPPFAGSFTKRLATRLETPVTKPQPIRELVPPPGPADRRYLNAAYDEEIALVDAAVGELLEGLEARGLDERALVILTSDHGEELFEHGGFEHGHALHRELVHVPLVVHAPGWLVPGPVDEPVSLVDVYPTILEALGIEHRMDGPARSLSGPARGEPAVGAPRALLLESLLYGHDRVGLVEWPYKLVVGPRAERRLFDLENDPEELKPLKQEAPTRDRAQRMQTALEALRAEARAGRPPREDRALDEETKRQLGALGYLEES